MPICCGGKPATPTLTTRGAFADAIHARYPGKLLAYNCSPSFNWEAKLDKATIAKFQRELGAMGYKFQFVTLAGFHSLNHSMFELASGYRDEGMAAYSRLQQAEFASEKDGYTATRHQREVGTGYFDKVALTLSAGTSSTIALGESTEAAQFAIRSSVKDHPMGQRYWVIGGEYRDCEFDQVVGHGRDFGTVPRSDPRPHRMAAADFPRPANATDPLRHHR